MVYPAAATAAEAMQLLSASSSRTRLYTRQLFLDFAKRAILCVIGSHDDATFSNQPTMVDAQYIVLRSYPAFVKLLRELHGSVTAIAETLASDYAVVRAIKCVMLWCDGGCRFLAVGTPADLTRIAACFGHSVTSFATASKRLPVHRSLDAVPWPVRQKRS